MIEAYRLPRCPKCGGQATVEHNPELGLRTQSRVRCMRCGMKTDWRMTRFQCEIEWEDMAS